jgi:HEAT repeat protein
LIRLAAFLPLLLPAALAAQDPDAKKRQREFEREVDKAISEFRKTYTKKDVDRIDGMKTLVALKHEKVIQELSRFLSSDTDLVRIAAIEALSELNHPKSADALAAGTGPNKKNKLVLAAILKAVEKLRWDTLTSATHFVIEDPFNSDYQDVAFEHVQRLKKVRSLASVDAFITMLKKAEEALRTGSVVGEGVQQMKDEALAALKILTSQSFTKHKEWEDWWKQAKTQAAADCIVEHWCERTWEHWEKLQSEKRKCPHHQDEKKLGIWKELACMYKLK